jgi:hypothetical protein
MRAWLPAWQRVHGTLRVTGWSVYGRRQDCRRKIEMSPGAQSRNDTPLAADATTQPMWRG